MVKTNADGRIVEFEEKRWWLIPHDLLQYLCCPPPSAYRTYRALRGQGTDMTSYQDILVRYKGLKVYAYKLNDTPGATSLLSMLIRTNMDFLKPEVRNYFFKEYPDIYSKVDDLPPAKYNPGAVVKNSLVSAAVS